MASKGGFWGKRPKGANLYFVTSGGEVAGNHGGVDAKDLVRSAGRPNDAMSASDKERLGKATEWVRGKGLAEIEAARETTARRVAAGNSGLSKSGAAAVISVLDRAISSRKRGEALLAKLQQQQRAVYEGVGSGQRRAGRFKREDSVGARERARRYARLKRREERVREIIRRL